MSYLIERYGAKRLQNICGLMFLLKYVIQFLGRSALYFGLIDASDTLYTYFVGIFSILGYVFLAILAASTVAEMFALCIIGFEIFYIMGRPFMLSIDPGDEAGFPIVYVFSVIFSIMAIYLWSLLLDCSKFRKKDLPWILILPLTFVLNIMVYAGNLMEFEHINTLATTVVIGLQALTPIRLCLAVILPICYWKLCHSECFSGAPFDGLEKYTLSPFNIYMLIYGLITVIILMPLNIL